MMGKRGRRDGRTLAQVGAGAICVAGNPLQDFVTCGIGNRLGDGEELLPFERSRVPAGLRLGDSADFALRLQIRSPCTATCIYHSFDAGDDIRAMLTRQHCRIKVYRYIAFQATMAESKTVSSDCKPQAEVAVRADRYDPQGIEQKWSERWAQDPQLYRAEPSSSARKKYYVL